MLQPDDVRKIRESIYHSQPEFAELIGRLRRVPISWRTVQNWELGRSNKPITFYQTDIDAIERATTPNRATCEVCQQQQAIVRKLNTNMCNTCATPLHQKDQRLLVQMTAA
jgi:hypothetical protein